MSYMYEGVFQVSYIYKRVLQTINMEKDNQLMEKVIISLIILVGAMLIFSQYQFYKISQAGVWTYLSLILILALVGLIAWYLVERNETHHHSEIAPHVHEEKPAPWTFIEKVSCGMVALVAILILFNQVQISQASALAGLSSPLTFKSFSSKTSLALTGDPSKDAFTVVIPHGVPFYGEALGVSFDDPIKGLSIIANLDPSYGRNKIQLTSEEKQRYIKIDTTPSMGCQYCCSVDTAVDSRGNPTCGCQHSWAIRGLTAYLVKNYPQLTDEEIMREVSKWKGLFFPKQMITKYIQESQTGKYSPDIASLLLSVDENKIKSAATPLASGSNTDTSTQPTSTDINNLPNMVGGC